MGLVWSRPATRRSPHVDGSGVGGSFRNPQCGSGKKAGKLAAKQKRTPLQRVCELGGRVSANHQPHWWHVFSVRWSGAGPCFSATNRLGVSGLYQTLDDASIQTRTLDLFICLKIRIKKRLDFMTTEANDMDWPLGREAGPKAGRLTVNPSVCPLAKG